MSRTRRERSRFHLLHYCAEFDTKAVSGLRTAIDPEENDRSIATHTHPFRSMSPRVHAKAVSDVNTADDHA